MELSLGLTPGNYFSQIKLTAYTIHVTREGSLKKKYESLFDEQSM